MVSHQTPVQKTTSKEVVLEKRILPFIAAMVGRRLFVMAAKKFGGKIARKITAKYLNNPKYLAKIGKEGSLLRKLAVKGGAASEKYLPKLVEKGASKGFSPRKMAFSGAKHGAKYAAKKAFKTGAAKFGTAAVIGGGGAAAAVGAKNAADGDERSISPEQANIDNTDAQSAEMGDNSSPPVTEEEEKESRFKFGPFKYLTDRNLELMKRDVENQPEETLSDKWRLFLENTENSIKETLPWFFREKEGESESIKSKNSVPFELHKVNYDDYESKPQNDKPSVPFVLRDVDYSKYAAPAA